MSRTARLLAAATLVTGIAAAAVPAYQSSAATSMSQSRHYPRVVQQWATAWNTEDSVAMSNLFTKTGTYTDHAFQATFTGPAGVKQWVDITKASITPVKADIHDVITSGNRIAVTWTFTGTFTAHTPFTPPYQATGKTFSVPATSVFTLRHNKIQSADDYYNLADILRQVDLPAGPFTPPSAG